MVEGGENNCIDCGHCVAVCPEGALSHRLMAVADCPPVHENWAPTPEFIEHYMRARRSVRAYEERPVDRDVLARLIDIARFAPTGSNKQMVRWLVIHDSDRVREVAQHTIDWMRHKADEDPSATSQRRILAAWDSGVEYICRSAPHLIIAHAPAGGSSTNCAIALSYLELAAPAFGVGTCWAGFVNAAANAWAPLQDMLGLPEGHTSYGGLLLGYPRHRYHRLPLRNAAQIIWQ
jgi:nitroreductase